MDLLIDDILSYSKVGQAELVRQKFSLKELVEGIIETEDLKIQYPNAKINVGRNLPNIDADRRMVTQLLTNLIGNALKYSSAKTHPVIEIGALEKNSETVFFVKDNGIGFGPEHSNKIFDVFSRLAGEEYKGSGVGLAIAKRVVEKHKGKIWVETVQGKGTTFFFTLKGG